MIAYKGYGLRGTGLLALSRAAFWRKRRRFDLLLQDVALCLKFLQKYTKLFSTT